MPTIAYNTHHIPSLLSTGKAANLCIDSLYIKICSAVTTLKAKKCISNIGRVFLPMYAVILVKLKLRINPYGKNIHIDMENESTSGITQDAHIWKLIESMEADKELKKFKTNKERMIMYLSLLLKHNIILNR